MSTFAKSPVAAAAAAVALIIATALVGGVVARPDPSTLTGASAPFNATDYGCPTWKLYKQVSLGNKKKRQRGWVWVRSGNDDCDHSEVARLGDSETMMGD